jgi:hypothetical protein
MDGDGQMYSARFIRVSPSAATLTTVLRFTAVNEGGTVPDTRHTVAPGPEDWWSLDVTYRHPIRGGWIEAGVGADYRDREWNDTEAVLPRASLSWRYQIQ